MNPLILFGLKVSFKNEIRVLLITFAVLLLLPIVGVVVLANSGLAAVSSALASVNPVTHKVEVKDANGLIVANLELSTAWPTRGSLP